MKVKQYAKGLIVVMLCAALASMLGLSACGSSSQPDASSQDDGESQPQYALVRPGYLTVATYPEYEPMEFEENGDIKGYDIALIKEIANRLGLTADIQSNSFDTLVAQVSSGKTFDCAISAIIIDDERSREVAFTDAYCNSSLAIVTLSDTDVTDTDQLNGMPVGALSGTASEKWVQENLPKSDLTPFQETDDLLGALGSGQVKAVICDESVARYQISTEHADCQILEVVSTGDKYGIIVNTGNVALADAINIALGDLLADGTIAKLRAEWFGEN